MNMKFDALRNGVELPQLAAKLPKVAVASGISGLIVAALILMTPNSWFEAFIVQTGLPNLIAAAEPPLGARARIVFALVAALVVTTIAWVALKYVTDRHGAEREPVSVYDLDEEAAERAVTDTPVLRRADAHPDHPPRAPIMAGDDLGTPLDLVDVADEPADVDDEFTAPDFAAENADHVEPHGNAEAEFASQAEEDFEAEEERTVDDSLPQNEAFPSLDVEVKPAALDRDRVSATETVPAPLASEGSVSSDNKAELIDLIARLEAGLDRRKERRSTAAEKAASEERDMDGALREALDALHRVTAKRA